MFAAALPLAAQAQETVGTIPKDINNCKYVGLADPLSLNTVVIEDAYTKTVKVQKEIFYCYESYSNIPDDKTLQDPLANRDKIGKGLKYIVEIEIFAFIAEDLSDFDPFPPGVTPPDVEKSFQVVRCVKERRTPTHQPGQASTMLETWVVAGCQYWNGDDVPALPTFATHGCVPEYNIPVPGGKSQKVTTRQPFVHGPIPVEDPIETNTVPIDFDDDGIPEWIKTVNVNKEVFRCFASGQPNAPVIYDIELYTEIYEDAGDNFGQELGKAFEVAYCAKKEKEAMLMGCIGGTWASTRLQRRRACRWSCGRSSACGVWS